MTTRIHLPDDTGRVLIVEDDPVTRCMLAAILAPAAAAGRAPGDALREAGSLAEAEALLDDAAAAPEVVLLDLSLPDSGPEATLGRVRALLPDAAVVILTSHDDDARALAALQEGAQDYLVKSALDERALRRAIRHARERQRLGRALRASEARFRAAFAHAVIGKAVLTDGSTWCEVNPALARMLGRAEAAMCGCPSFVHVHPDDRPTHAEALRALRAGRRESDGWTARWRHAEGHDVWVQVSAVALDPAASGLADGGRTVLLEVQDVTERRAAEEAMRGLSLLDDLTGLYNRRGFRAHARSVLRECERNGATGLVLYMDLDGLKAINDRWGHEAGDAAIRRTAELLRSTSRTQDVLARLGGDEFAACLPYVAPADVPRVVRRVTEVVETAALADATPWTVALSVGGAAFDGRNPQSLEALLAEADRALYAEKRARAAAGRRLPAGASVG